MTAPSDDDLLARAQAALGTFDQRHVLALLPSAPLLRAQLAHLERWYRGGLASYLHHASRLLPDYEALPGTAPADDAVDAFADWLPAVDAADTDAPELAALGSRHFQELEALGAQHVGDSAFVVVAGGLGERLGYHDLKLKLPTETLTRTSYLARYAAHLLALEALANAKKQDEEERVRIPLAIMTSDATHDATRAYLDANANFGMRADQVALVRQEKVPCLDLQLVDGQSRLMLVLDESARALVMKPHGHGDVHALLHASGLAAQWAAQGKRFVHFFQDTNALIANSFLPMLGASVRHTWAFNFTTVQRKAKDASGAVVRFCKPLGVHEEKDEEAITALFNVEYHELDAFLRTKASAAFPDGDANDPSTGFSLFPGNINHFVVELASYIEVLRVSGGFVPEVFNPKTTGSGASRRFKSPARLECMMQDYPKLLIEHRELLAKITPSSSRIGFVLFPPALVYSPCKNDVESARDKALHDIPPQCAGSAEHDLFAVNRDKLRALGIEFHTADDAVDDARDQPREWLGIPLDCTGPQLVFGASFAPTQAILSSRFPSPTQVRISRRSTLVVEGDVTIHSLELTGALRVSACAGASVEIKNLRVHNAGYEYSAVKLTEHTDPIDAMRGYTFVELGIRELVFDTPGHYTVDEA